jgi:hypothetical protein
LSAKASVSEMSSVLVITPKFVADRVVAGVRRQRVF